MVLVKNALRNEEPTRKIKLSENVWFITDVFPVDKDATFLLPTIKCNYYNVIFLQMVTFLKIISFNFMAGVRNNAMQTLFSRTSSPIDAGTGFISSDSRRWYWALLTPFLPNLTILSVSKRLQLLLTVSSEWTIPEKIQTGGLRIWNFQGYQRNSMWNFQGLIKNEVEFQRVTKKK